MEIPVRSVRQFRHFGMGGAVLFLAMLAGCSYAPRFAGPVGLENEPVHFNRGRVTVVLTDENGTPMPGYKVDFAWERPDFYRTSAFTDRNGQVTFSGIPDVAEVSINHEGGIYERTLLVPQTSISELRVMVDTYGAFEIRRQQEQARAMGLRPQQQ